MMLDEIDELSPGTLVSVDSAIECWHDNGSYHVVGSSDDNRYALVMEHPYRGLTCGIHMWSRCEYVVVADMIGYCNQEHLSVIRTSDANT